MEGNICLKAQSKDTAHKAALILLSSPVTFFLRLISENRVSQGNLKYIWQCIVKNLKCTIQCARCSLFSIINIDYKSRYVCMIRWTAFLWGRFHLEKTNNILDSPSKNKINVLIIRLTRLHCAITLLFRFPYIQIMNSFNGQMYIRLHGRNLSQLLEMHLMQEQAQTKCVHRTNDLYAVDL